MKLTNLDPRVSVVAQGHFVGEDTIERAGMSSNYFEIRVEPNLDNKQSVFQIMELELDIWTFRLK